MLHWPPTSGQASSVAPALVTVARRQPRQWTQLHVMYNAPPALAKPLMMALTP